MVGRKEGDGRKEEGGGRSSGICSNKNKNPTTQCVEINQPKHIGIIIKTFGIT